MATEFIVGVDEATFNLRFRRLVYFTSDDVWRLEKRTGKLKSQGKFAKHFFSAEEIFLENNTKIVASFFV